MIGQHADQESGREYLIVCGALPTSRLCVAGIVAVEHDIAAADRALQLRLQAAAARKRNQSPAASPSASSRTIAASAGAGAGASASAGAGAASRSPAAAEAKKKKTGNHHLHEHDVAVGPRAGEWKCSNCTYKGDAKSAYHYVCKVGCSFHLCKECFDTPAPLEDPGDGKPYKTGKTFADWVEYRDPKRVRAALPALCRLLDHWLPCVFARAEYSVLLQRGAQADQV
jgi:hypothetical protein